MTQPQTKGEARKARQAEYTAREAQRLATGDTRTSAERHAAEYAAAAERQRRQRRAPRPTPGSLQRAEERGGLIGGYETDDTYCPD